MSAEFEALVPSSSACGTWLVTVGVACLLLWVALMLAFALRCKRATGAIWWAWSASRASVIPVVALCVFAPAGVLVQGMGIRRYLGDQPRAVVVDVSAQRTGDALILESMELSLVDHPDDPFVVVYPAGRR